MQKKGYIAYFRGLELLRFLLSLVVIIYHYQHFFYPFVPLKESSLYHFDQPFYRGLSFVYTYGYYAVQVFWLISGIIFYKVYQEKVAEHKIDFRSFTINRFSRLYPLHLLMLIIVCALQFCYYSRYSSFFVYPHNSGKDFLQNLLFVQTWGENKFSFNGPTWSVSIEILVYIVFFIIAKSGFLKTPWTLFLTLVFFTIVKKWQLIFLNDDLNTCFYFFFSGCMFIFLYDRIKENRAVLLAAFLLAGGALYLVLSPPTSLASIIERATGYLDIHLLLISMLLVASFLFIFSLSLFDRVNSKLFQFFGDMTYSTYLIHFPIQLAIFLFLKPDHYQIFLQPKIFIIYILLIAILGRLIFVYVEMPVQSWLRGKFHAKQLS